MAAVANPAQRNETIVLNDTFSLYSGSPKKIRGLINEYLDIDDLLRLMVVSRSHFYATIGSAFQDSVWIVQQRKLGYHFEVTDVPLAHQVIQDIFKKAEAFSSRFKFIEQVTKSPKTKAVNAKGYHLHRVALKALRALVKWFPNRDTLMVWEKVAQTANLKRFDEPTSIEDTAQKAGAFEQWIGEHQTTLDLKTELKLEELNITFLHPAIGKLTRLQDLSLEDNKLCFVPTFIGQLSSLKSLVLRKNRLNSLPEVIWKLYSLQFLNIEDNLLTEVSPAIRNLTSLTALYFSENKFTQFPRCLGEIPRLQQLYFYSNQLTSISLTEGQFTALQRLDVSKNQLTSFHACQLSSLETLELQVNRLTSLDSNIHQLVGLRSLNLRENQLSSLPETIFALARLTSVNLRNNQIPKDSDVIKRLREKGIKVYL